MFRTLVATIIVTLSVFTLTLYSCEKDACKKVNCQNGGLCDNGGCVCPTGYSGARCEIYEPCMTITCMNGGTCVDGKCNCPLGFEGQYCETISRNKFFGLWVVTEDGTTSNPAQYTVSLVAGSTANEVRILNFRNTSSNSVIAFVYRDTIRILPQNIGGFDISGEGMLTGDLNTPQDQKIDFRYKVSKDGVTDDFGVDVGNPSLWKR